MQSTPHEQFKHSLQLIPRALSIHFEQEDPPPKTPPHSNNSSCKGIDTCPRKKKKKKKKDIIDKVQFEEGRSVV